MSSIVFSSDGGVLAVGEVSGAITLREMATGALLTSMQVGSGETTATDWHPQQQVLASGGRSGEILIWDTNTAETSDTITELSSQIISLKWSPDGSMLAAASRDGQVTVWTWNGADFQQEMTINIDAEPTCLDWSPNSDAIVVGDVGGVLTLIYVK